MLDSLKAPQRQRFLSSFTPEKVGQHTLQISVPTQAGESISANNSASLSINVLRDKIRVLMISGNPSMNYRFMRTALKNDPSIDLLSFVILRTPTNILNVPIQEQSLIPFPVETLFTKELSSFDLLVFDNLPSHLYIPPDYLSNIREFVRKRRWFRHDRRAQSFGRGAIRENTFRRGSSNPGGRAGTIIGGILFMR